MACDTLQHRRPGLLGVVARAAAAVLCLALAPLPLAPLAWSQPLPDGMPDPGDMPSPEDRPSEIRGMELEDHLGEKLPLLLSFTDSDGKEVSLATKFGNGRPVVIAMVYLRCPLLCPQLQQKVVASFNQISDFTIGTDYDVLFVSFDPRDRPVDAAKWKEINLAAYSRPTTEQVRQGMSFLVGSAMNTRKLASALGFPYKYLPKSGEFSHGTAIYVVTPEGVISRCFPKLEYEPRDMRLAMVEASDGKIGTLVDRFTLWCYHSTSTGEYVIAAQKVMKIGAAGAAFLLASFMGMWLFRDLRRKRRRDPQPAGAAGAEGSGGGTRHAQVALKGALGHSR